MHPYVVILGLFESRGGTGGEVRGTVSALQLASCHILFGFGRVVGLAVFWKLAPLDLVLFCSVVVKHRHRSALPPLLIHLALLRGPLRLLADYLDFFLHFLLRI